MITGKLRSQIDKLWEQFWTGGITNPLTVIEQISFLTVPIQRSARPFCQGDLKAVLFGSIPKLEIDSATRSKKIESLS